MSLLYIIDGYNTINHPLFTRSLNKKIRDRRLALMELIRAKRLSGSPKNTVTIVFDGYPNPQDNLSQAGINTAINLIFSRQDSADDKIREMIENNPDRKNALVVSDDKEIVFFIKAEGARHISVEEFIGGKKESKRRKKEEDQECELTYSQVHAINEEMKKLWLK